MFLSISVLLVFGDSKERYTICIWVICRKQPSKSAGASLQTQLIQPSLLHFLCQTGVLSLFQNIALCVDIIKNMLLTRFVVI